MRGGDAREVKGEWEGWPVAMGDHPSDSATEMLEDSVFYSKSREILLPGANVCACMLGVKVWNSNSLHEHVACV